MPEHEASSGVDPMMRCSDARFTMDWASAMVDAPERGEALARLGQLVEESARK